AGVDARWYPVPRGALLHAKIGLFDDELLLGSANWTLSGLGVNHELDITTEDGGVIAAYRTRFEGDWSRSQERGPIPRLRQVLTCDTGLAPVPRGCGAVRPGR